MKPERVVGRLQAGGETALVADIGVVPGRGERLLECREDLGTDPHRLGDAADADRHDHELLDVDRVVGMLAAVDDVHHRHRQRARVGAADVAVQRHALVCGGRLGDRERDGEDGVRPQPRLVRRAVEVDHQVVDAHLLARLHAADRVEDFALGESHRLAHALAAVALSYRRRAVRQPRGRRWRHRTARRPGLRRRSPAPRRPRWSGYPGCPGFRGQRCRRWRSWTGPVLDYAAP